MDGLRHYQEAEKMIAQAGPVQGHPTPRQMFYIGLAQVHAILAASAAQLVASSTLMQQADWGGWRTAVSGPYQNDDYSSYQRGPAD